MQNLHDDKNLDSLSRDAAEDFTPDPSLHSWEQLKPGLDRELPEKKEKKRRLIFILFFFLLIGGGIVSAVLLNRQGTQQQTGTTDKSIKELPVEPGTTSGTGGNTTAQPKANGTTPARQQPVNDPVSGQSTASGKATSDKTTNNKSQISIAATTNDSRTNPKQIDAPVNAGRKNQTARKNNPVTNADAKQDVSNDVTSDVVKHQPATSATDKKTDPKDQPAVIDNKPVVTNDKPAVTDEKPVADNKTADKKDQPSVAENKPPVTKSKLNSKSRNPSVAASRWEFGAVYAPDVSTVKFTHTQKPGMNLGLTIGYNISRRFAVQTGAIYTIKNYKSRGEDYHPPKGYWTDYVKLETVAADCDMWDIPINLRYNLVPKHRSNLFVSTGLSSYFMRSEDYDFFYYYNGNPVNRYREYETKTKHWFSVLNLSVGYERQVSKNFSVQAEPFFKQPLKGVGFGNVKLNSTGIFFSVKYKPVSKRR
jgi:hypothetical protein